MTTATKASLESLLADRDATIADLRAQLDAATPADPRSASMIRLVGMLKSVKDVSREGGKRTASAIIINSSLERRGEQQFNVDLPADSLIATDNGQPLASTLLDIDANTVWARVAVTGFWVPFGDIAINGRGYPSAQRRQLRIQTIEVLNARPADAPGPAADPYPAEPTSDEIPF